MTSPGEVDRWRLELECYRQDGGDADEESCHHRG